MRIITLLTLVICFLLISCSDKYERKINQHFRKFILKEKLKDYKIEKIKRSITTFSQEQLKLTADQINRKKYQIGLYAKTVTQTKEDLDEIKKGSKRTFAGMTYYATKNLFPTNNGFYNASAHENLFDLRNEGKEKIIENKINYINSQLSQITKIENEIKILQIKLDSIKENPNNSPKWINSIVTISGIEASGLKRINYFVVQYPDGVIKSVN